MKIGLLLPSVYMGRKYKDKIFAPKDLFLNLANSLVDFGHQVYVYSSPDTKTKARLVPGHEELIAHDFISPKFRGLDRIERQKNAHAVTRIEYEIDVTVKAYFHAREQKLDIMHAYHDFMAHYINRLIGIPTVYTVHDPRPRPEHLEHWRFTHFRTDNYIFISNSQRRIFRNLVSSVGVIYHGVDINKFAFDPRGGEYLAFIGRYIKEKGVTEAIAAAKEIGMLLRMVGDDAYRVLPYYQTRVKPHLKKGMVEDETFVGEGDRGMFLKNAKALLFPIQWEESFGMVMVESMSCGTPVIAFDRGSVREIVKNGETGFVVSPRERIKGLAQAIRKIQTMSEHEYQKMRLACRVHVEKNFTIELMAKNHEKLYQGLLEKSKVSRTPL